MPDLPTPPAETPGQHCARWLKSAKAKAQETNSVLTWAEVAKIIDATLTGLDYFKQVNPPISPVPSQPAGKAQKSEVPTPEAIYAAYPRKVGKKAAIEAIKRAMKRIGDDPTWKQVQHLSPAHLLFDKVKVFASYVSLWVQDERQYCPHPSTWFNQGRYDDDPKEWQRGKPTEAIQPKNYSVIG